MKKVRATKKERVHMRNICGKIEETNQPTKKTNDQKKHIRIRQQGTGSNRV